MFGQGYGNYLKKKKDKKQLFEDHIEQLKKKKTGGCFDLYFLAEMLEKKIEIQEISEEIFSINPFGASAEPIFLVEVRQGRGFKYNGKNSIYGAIAELINEDEETLKQRFQQYLGADEMAEETFDQLIKESKIFKVDSFENLTGGAPRHGNLEQQVKVSRNIFKKRSNSIMWTETITATVRKNNLGQGSDATSSIWNKLKKMRNDGDHISHGIGVMLGGPGNTEDNFFLMKGRLNMKQYKIEENKICRLIRNNVGWRADITVKLSFKKDFDNGNRPYEIVLSAKFYDSKNKLQEFKIDQKFIN